jgi:hypothetical protein
MCCAKVGNHNRDRSDTLQLERKYETNNWEMRVNKTILAMSLVDCWKVFSKLSFSINEEGQRVQKETQKQFYGKLVAELINNKEDSVTTRDRSVAYATTNLDAMERHTGYPSTGIGPRLTPTKKRRKNNVSETTTHRWQGYCVVCHQKTTQVCSLFNDDQPVASIEVFGRWLGH